jgi:hypothetical protein
MPSAEAPTAETAAASAALTVRGRGAVPPTGARTYSAAVREGPGLRTAFTKPHTSSPAASPVTSLAAAVTVPAKSNPVPRGKARPLTSLSFPARTEVSAPLTLLAATRTSTCPGRSRGTGTVRTRRTSGGP